MVLLDASLINYLSRISIEHLLPQVMPKELKAKKKIKKIKNQHVAVGIQSWESGTINLRLTNF